ncbi:hypothetical protein [Kitasatospora sp. NPDC101183]|uniref:hypothetical protein n=1 Tax=Kitasatospora sp. NPDC101183 TaxID=3364100 RepID=UPI0037F32870
MTAPVVAGPRPRPGAADRPRVLLAPVTITPSKPLSPSHLKGLLWTDVMYRATLPLAEVAYRYSHTTYHPTEQTLGFWEFLDRTRGATDVTGFGEERIGELYTAFRAADRAPARALAPYAEAVEQGWVHPVATRVLRLWSRHYAALGLHDPGLLRHQPPGLGLDAALDRLAVLGMCLDQRGLGGPAYLDLTRFGLPLRRLVSADGRPNYLACALRELVPLAPEFDEVVLLYDDELDADYQLLERVLTALGPRVRRISVGRVPIEGRVHSSRHGAWRGLHAGTLLDTASAGHSEEAVRLGTRLYFVAVLGPGRQQSYREDLLLQCVRRAARLLDEAGPEADGEALRRELARHRKDHAYVNPYRLTTHLLGRRHAAPAADLLKAVFL